MREHENMVIERQAWPLRGHSGHDHTYTCTGRHADDRIADFEFQHSHSVDAYVMIHKTEHLQKHEQNRTAEWRQRGFFLSFQKWEDVVSMCQVEMKATEMRLKTARREIGFFELSGMILKQGSEG